MIQDCVKNNISFKNRALFLERSVALTNAQREEFGGRAIAIARAGHIVATGTTDQNGGETIIYG
jgi:hypothetical protein